MNFKRVLTPLPILFFALINPLFSQQFYHKIDPSLITIGKPTFKQMAHYQAIKLEKNKLQQYLNSSSPNEKSDLFLPLTLPLANGRELSFNVQEAPVMEEGLAAKYPQIKTYKAYSQGYSLRFILSPYSFQAIILGNGEETIIESLSDNDQQYYAVFDPVNLPTSVQQSFSCGTDDRDFHPNKEINIDPLHSSPQLNFRGNGEPKDLKTYRLALACTALWGDQFGQSDKAIALDKMAAAVMILNAIYIKDFGAQLILVNNNDNLIHLNGVDPYSDPRSGRSNIGENTGIINPKIGSRNYEIGHVFTIGCSDVGGVASLGSLCQINKGSGCTCWYTSDVYYVVQRIFCHEMGHQFACTHTFSYCGGNEELSTAYEPGSGTTIMSYSGLCGSANVETSGLPHPNFFHASSLEQALFLTRKALTCGSTSNTNNTTPSISIQIPKGLYLPISTPIKLVGSATDMEGDSLTYSWEQYNAGPYGETIGQVSLDQEGPLVKVNFPSLSPIRYVPSVNTILFNRNINTREILPSVTRNFNFRFVVRDNNKESGASVWDQINFKVTDQAGPFKVTRPNSSTEKLVKNSCNLIRWDVANTNSFPVSCKKVSIYLLNKRNIDNPILIKENTDNDGEEIVDLGDVPLDNQSRIMVSSVGNIFFDVSDQDIQVIENGAPNSYMFSANPKNPFLCLPNLLELDLTSCFSGNLTGQLNLFLEGQLPEGTTYKFNQQSLNLKDQSKLTMDFNSLTTKTEVDFIVGAVTPAGDSIKVPIHLIVIKNDFSDLSLVSPIANGRSITQSPKFQWTKSVNANSYTLEIATSPGFGVSTIYTKSDLTADQFQLPIFLDPSIIYYWRVIPFNECAMGSSSETFAFQTVNKKCTTKEYSGNPQFLLNNDVKRFVLPVFESGTISDINVKNVDIDADAVKDIQLALVSPTGTKCTLFSYSCGISLRFDCSFDDDAINGIFCPPANKVTMRPVNKLSVFNGQNSQGDWLLEVSTKNSLVSGFMNNFQLEYCASVTANNPYNIINQPLYLNNGETKLIPNSLLASKDDDNTASELVYTLVAIPAHGNLKLNGNNLNYGSTFTQADIDAGKLSYQHRAQVNNSIDGFRFTVNDGASGWYGIDLFTIYIGNVATQDLTSNSNLLIVPNPSQGTFHLLDNAVSSEIRYFNILDLSGKKLNSTKQNFQLGQEINVSYLNSGIYFIEWNTDNRKYFSKLIISKS